MDVRVFRWPNGAWSISRAPLGDQPVVLAMLASRSALPSLLEPVAGARLAIDEAGPRQQVAHEGPALTGAV